LDVEQDQSGERRASGDHGRHGPAHEPSLPRPVALRDRRRKLEVEAVERAAGGVDAVIEDQVERVPAAVAVGPERRRRGQAAHHQRRARQVLARGHGQRVAVHSAPAALHLGLVALGVRPGDEIVTSTYTFAACVNVMEHLGARPVLVDVEPDTLCMDPARLEASITPRTRAVMPVDYGGHPCDLDAIAAIGSRHGLPIVEDAAHALGARWKGHPVGSFSTVTAFSFYATKNLTTGEGGAAVTDDGALAERISLLSLHGMNRDAWKRYTDTGSWYYEITAPGFKYNLSDVLAAIGLGQLERFDDMQRIRAARVARYDANLADVPEVRRPRARPDVVHAWHLYPVGLELERLSCDRARFIQELRAENIGTSVHFIPIHLHPHFAASLGVSPGQFPVAEDAYQRAVTLPLFARMSESDVEDVCS